MGLEILLMLLSIDNASHMPYHKNMNKRHKAELILFQLAAIREGEFQEGSIRLLGLINEVLRDAKELAEATVDEEDKKKAA